MSNFYPRWIFKLRYTLLPVLLLLMVAVPPARSQLQELDLDRIKQATVFILQVRTDGDQFVITCVGSGTIVSAGGLVLTNAHHTVQSRDCNGDALIVAMSVRPDEPPVPRYRASVTQVNPGIDLALLRIDRELDGRLLNPDDLPLLPFVELADSATLSLDATITVIGYPDIGNEGAAAARGTIIGFMAEPSGGERSWIKTTAIIPGTMSGGGAYDLEGRLIGIPTTAPTRATVPGNQCKLVQDTNRDGIINNADSCVPVGDLITAIRPSNFARPLIRAATLNLDIDIFTAPTFQASGLEQPTISRLFFAPSVTSGTPISVVGSLPTGTSSLYLFFDYNNMTPETVYELRVSIDGLPSDTFSLQPVRWSGGSSGMWYIGSSGQRWPNGVYEFRLFVDGIAAGTRTIVVGTSPEPGPAFSNVVFGLLDLQGNILGNGYVLPAGPTATARFIYQNMTNGLPWTVIWYYNGQQIARSDDTWQDDASGAKTVSLQPAGGLVPGNYRVELAIEGRLSATADFVIAGAQEGAIPQVFTDTHFTTAASPQEAVLAAPISTFPNTVTSLYTLFDWQFIAPGTLWTMRWSVDGEAFYEQTVPWNSAESGQDFLTRLSSPTTIPDGTYSFDLFVNGVQLDSAAAVVGIGQLPIDRFARATGVKLTGRIVDAETGHGIEGVTFILISEDFSIAEFVWDQEQIYDLAVTDRNGDFEISRPLQLTAPYSVLIAAQGYLPVAADGFTIQENQPVELLIPLTRDG